MTAFLSNLKFGLSLAVPKSIPLLTRYLFIIFAFCSFNTFAHSKLGTDPSAKPYTLSMRINGATTGNGTLMIAVFNEGSSFPNGKPFKTMSVSGKEERSKVLQMNLPRDTYAVAVFLDVNNNTKLDSNMFGYPTEPYGFSNNAKGNFGPPDFNAAAILLEADTHVEISLN